MAESECARLSQQMILPEFHIPERFGCAFHFPAASTSLPKTQWREPRPTHFPSLRTARTPSHGLPTSKSPRMQRYEDQSGDNSTMDIEARLGPNALLGNSVSIGEASEVSQSILFDRVTVGEGSLIQGAIVSTDVKVGNGVKICRGCIISSPVTIADRTKIGAGAIIHPPIRRLTETSE